MPKQESKDLFKKLIPWWIIFLAIVFYCYEFFLRISPSVVIPQLMHQYQFGALGIGLLASVYYAAYVIGQIPGGYLLDRYPIGIVLGMAMLLCGLSAFAFVATTSPAVAMSSRFLLGLASSVSFIGVLHLARQYLPHGRFTLVAGIAISLGTLAGSYAQIAAAYLVAESEWIRLFIDAGMMGLILAVLIGLALQWVAPLHPTKKSASHNWKQVFKLLRNKVLWINGIMGGLFYLPTSVFAAVWGIHFLQTTYGLSETGAAYSISYLFLGWVIATPLFGWVAEHWGCERQLLWFGCIGLSAVIFMILFLPAWVSPYLNAYFLVFGLISSVQVVVWKFYNDLLSHELAGLGIALTNMIIMLTTSVAHIVVGFLIDVDSNFSLLPSHINARASLLLMPLALVLGLFAVRYIPKREAHESAEIG